MVLKLHLKPSQAICTQTAQTTSGRRGHTKK